MKQIVSERKDIAFFIKMNPLPIHKEAYDKAKAIMCNKSLDMLEDAFAKKPLPRPSCQTKTVDEAVALAKKLGISGAPAIVLPDGRLITGYMDAKSMKEMIDRK